MGNKKNKLSVNHNDLISASSNLREAESKIKSALNAINGINVSTISGAGMGPAGIMFNIKSNASTILRSESNLLDKLSNDIRYNANILDSADRKKNEIKENDNGGDRTTKKLQISPQTSNESSNLNSDADFSSIAETAMTFNTGAVLKPAGTILINQLLRNLNTLLKKGDTKKALELYNSLKGCGSEAEAKKIIENNGYTLTDNNGKTGIGKVIIAEPETNNTTDTNTNTSNSNVESSEATSSSNTSNSTDNTTSSDTEVVATEINTNSGDNSNQQSTNNGEVTNVIQNRSNQTKNINRSTTTVNTSNQPSGNNEQSTTQTTNNSTVVKETKNVTDKVTPNKNKTNTNVVTIKDDGPTITTNKKSSSMSAAIPIGLGTIATGAAAVAGLRYVKSRKENQEDYDQDESYDDNDLDDTEEYSDSAQYDSGIDYTDDNYLGPAGSTYTDIDNADTMEDYVDPDDLADTDEEGFNDDSVLEQLNSNY